MEDYGLLMPLSLLLPSSLLLFGGFETFFSLRKREDIHSVSKERDNTLRVKYGLVISVIVCVGIDFGVMTERWTRFEKGATAALLLGMAEGKWAPCVHSQDSSIAASIVAKEPGSSERCPSVAEKLDVFKPLWDDRPPVLIDFHLILLTLTLVSILFVFYLECLGPSATNCRSNEEGKIRLADDGTEEIECPVLEANIFSVLTFNWITPLMKLGTSKFLEETDLWALPKQDRSNALAERLRYYWEKQMLKKKPSLVIALCRAYGWDFLVAAGLKFVQDMLAFAQPQLLRKLLAFVATWNTENPAPAKDGYTIAIIMFAFAVTQTIFINQYFQRVTLTGMRNRAGLVGLIYAKSLILSNEERGRRATGDIVNLMSSDSWSGILQLVVAFISLYKLVGFSVGLVSVYLFLAGVSVLLLSMPANILVTNVQARFQKNQMKNKGMTTDVQQKSADGGTDQRMRIMSEILNNILSIKLYAWENSFVKKLFAVRNDREIRVLQQMGLLIATSNMLWQLTPFLVAFCTFFVYTVTSNAPLTADLVFPAIALFQLLAFPLTVLPQCITALVEAWVSVVRLRDFLQGKELQKDAVQIEEVKVGELKWGDELIKVENGEFTWQDGPNKESTLMDIDLTVKKGQLVTVVGVVGSGKRLGALLGEMTRREGCVNLRGKFVIMRYPLHSLADIVLGSVKANIIFGCHWDAAFYERVLDACALRDDLAILPDGDLVGRHVFDHVIGPEGLLASKARLLCTNAIHYCQQSDEIIMLHKGVPIERGNSELSQLLAQFGKKDSKFSDGTKSRAAAVNLDQTCDDDDDADSALPDLSQSRKESNVVIRRASMMSIRQQKKQTLRELRESTRSKEKKETGNVKRKIYKIYIKASSVMGVSSFLFFILAAQSLSIATNSFLKYWATRNSETGDNGGSSLGFYLGVYLALGLGSVACQFAASATLSSWASVNAARKMHDGMEATPIGVILNRFSRDVQIIDEVLSRMIFGLFRTLGDTVAVIIVIGYSVPVFLIAIIPLGMFYRQVQTYYLATSRELRRIDSTTKSPIFGMFQETLAGLPTIRAYRQQKRFVAENEARIDRNLEAYFASVSCNRWLSVRLEFLGSCVILMAAVSLVYALEHNHGALDAGLVGIVMSYALNTTQSLNCPFFHSCKRSISDRNIKGSSAMRPKQVTTNILCKPSDDSVVEGNRPRASWPENGRIQFSHVNLRYREGLDCVLKDVSFEAEPGMKIGICGRTGAGKSTLTMALYRIVEPASGQIFIDEVDITNIGLHDLRSKLSIIPQDSQCFEGTLRDNVDPTGEADDDAIWKALEQARLKEHVQSMGTELGSLQNGELDAVVNEGGSNLSAGQSTAKVDPQSDAAIQNVIRKEFADCTILVIAHRLNTIMDCDRILVMSAGRVAEFDSPANLLQKKDSIFYSLAVEAGVAQS
ncbi:hypothetical protein BT69DRAFT_1292537 [Atractiella rhizophila]|nr:hypothetical protein BT69DRAFT_1292537 [Atractiella rhizophila]